MVAIALIVVGIIHLLPAAGILGSDRLQSLYGISLADPNLVLLMRHRAVLFGILGMLFLSAAFIPSLQLTALVMALVSVTSFLVLASTGTQLNSNMARIVAADWVALVAVLAGLVAYGVLRRRL